MKAIPALLGSVGLSVVLALPAYAQQAAATTPVQPPVATQRSTSGPNGTLEKYHGKWRASKLVGSNVYNQAGQTVGSIDDLLVDSDGKVDGAVLSVGGFLGIGGKLVEIPFSEFKFEESKSSAEEAPASGAAAPASAAAVGTASTPIIKHPAGTSVAAKGPRVYYSIVLPSATKSSLSSAAEFKYSG